MKIEYTCFLINIIKLYSMLFLIISHYYFLVKNLINKQKLLNFKDNDKFYK